MPKRLIVCSDGTWNTPDQSKDGTPCPTNVVKIARAIRPNDDDGRAQVVFYDQGVGTGKGLDHWTGGAFGRGLEKNVEDAYRFLVSNYEEGDEIFLFGFSRGAYTVRSTAGLIRNCGILRKRESHRIPEAYAMYRRKDAHPDSEEARDFRSKYSSEAFVYFIGVWDTVGALGIPVSFLRFLTRRKYEFHDVTLSSTVKYAYHALAIDELRKAFRPAIWDTKRTADQTVEQIWFSGAHSNVGGGYSDAGLSDIALDWMVQKALAVGLAFDPVYLEEHVRPDFRGKLIDSRSGFYKLLGKFVRALGVGEDPTQSIDASVEHRHADGALAYAPSNLITVLERGTLA